MGLSEAALGHQRGASPSAWHSRCRTAYCFGSLRDAACDRLGARRGDSHEAIVISANGMDAALSAGELACQLPPCLASLGRDCRDHTRCIRDTGVARLCGARRLAAAGWNLWLPAWRVRLRLLC